MTERVVCANTLGMALAEDGKLVKVSHRTHFDAASVKAQMGITVDNFQRFISQARALAKCDVSPKAADQFMLQLLAPVPAKLEEQEYADTVRCCWQRNRITKHQPDGRMKRGYIKASSR